MKETVKTSRTVGYIEKIFRNLNDHYFGNEISNVVITISPTAGAYGHCSVCKIWNVKDDESYEINISSYTLKRPIENVVATLLHEMVHLWNIQHGIQDCSRNYTYHNRKFKDKAESVDLIISKDDRYGWTITEPSEKLIEYIISMGWSDIEMNRQGAFSFMIGKGKDDNNDTSGASQTGKKTSWRWICPECNMIVRSTKDLTGKLKCTDCDKTLIES